MDSEQTHPLSPQEAKARLRAAAQRASPSGWVRHHPLQAVALALGGGFVIARLRIEPILGAALTRRLLPAIAARLLTEALPKTTRRQKTD